MLDKKHVKHTLDDIKVWLCSLDTAEQGLLFPEVSWVRCQIDEQVWHFRPFLLPTDSFLRFPNSLGLAFCLYSNKPYQYLQLVTDCDTF